MFIIDTHTHIYLPDFDDDREAMLERAISRGIQRMLMPNIDLASMAAMLALTARWPENCFPMLGLHPCSVPDEPGPVLEQIDTLFEKGGWIAVGETGIDLYWDKSRLVQQRESFRRHIYWSLQHSLPLVIHARESFHEIFSLLKEDSYPGLTGVFHCFSGDAETARNCLAFDGFMLGIGGVLTYKKAGLPEVLKEVPITRIVLETDAPYLSPVPHRGKRNEPAYLIYVLEELSKIYEISPEEVALQTTSNARKLFTLIP